MLTMCKQPPAVQGPDAAGVGAAFLSVLPRVAAVARFAFRHVRCPDTRADRVAEAVALCWKKFLRLFRAVVDRVKAQVLKAAEELKAEAADAADRRAGLLDAAGQPGVAAGLRARALRNGGDDPWPGEDREPGAGGRPPAGSNATTGWRRMGARERLNAAYAGGAAVFAAYVGAGFKSWTVFAVVLVVALVLCLLGGHIRPAGRRG